jgi:hypothetical protein
VVAGTVGYSSNLKDGDVLTTLSGGIINIAIRDGAVFANDVQVTTPDVLVANGVVHVVDGYVRCAQSSFRSGLIVLSAFFRSCLPMARPTAPPPVVLDPPGPGREPVPPAPPSFLSPEKVPRRRSRPG